MKKIIIMGAALTAIVGSIFLGMHFFNKLRTEYIKKEKLETIKMGMEQLEELKKLGFFDNNTRVKTIKDRISLAHRDLLMLEKEYQPPIHKLEQFIAQAYQMAHSYRNRLHAVRDFRVKKHIV